VTPSDMDPEIVPLADALNRLPGICTIASCSGHMRRGPWITFQVENQSDLVPLAYCCGHWWSVGLEPASEDPPVFCLQGPYLCWIVTARLLIERIDEWLK